MPQLPATPAEYHERLELVESLIVKGMEQREIVRYLKEKHEGWGLTDRQLRNYVHEAKERLSSAAKGVDRAAEFAIAKQRNDLLFSSSLKIQDYRTALAANVQNIKLMRLDRPNADFDWRAAAQQAGINPQDIIAQFIETINMEGVIEDE